MAPHPLIDKEAPSFTLLDANGESFKFPPEEGGKRVNKPIAVFFYPQSGTFGCTREACQFRDALAENEIFKRSNVQVIGISADPVEKQKSFVQKNRLSFPVLSDQDHVAHKAFQVGRGMFGLTDARTTFVIDNGGIVRGVLSATMNYNAHAKFVTRELEKIQESQKKTGEQLGEGAGEQQQARPVTPEAPASSPERDELGRAANVVSA
ncbi:thioredoxin-like protein [Pisolithus croceorrhizus]|nr:thioredoxin-like protein [Pisolithus croceorrhizus]KAI6166770.1 thioredoxin-like protein [Pisolithus thermaeus]